MNMAKSATAPKSANELAGITLTECASGCNADGCVISGKPRCAHPAKGGLDQHGKQDPAAMARFERAKKIIGKKKIDPTES